MATRKEASEATGRRRLGRGLSGLISSAVSIALPQDRQEQGGATEPEVSETEAPAAPAATDVGMIPTNEIRANPRQPRQRFDDAGLEALAASIRTRRAWRLPLLVRPPSRRRSPLEYSLGGGGPDSS